MEKMLPLQAQVKEVDTTLTVWHLLKSNICGGLDLVSMTPCI